MTVHTAEKKTNKIFFLKISEVKSHSSMSKLLLDFPAVAINCVYSSLWSLAKGFFTITTSSKQKKTKTI